MRSIAEQPDEASDELARAHAARHVGGGRRRRGREHADYADARGAARHGADARAARAPRPGRARARAGLRAGRPRAWRPRARVAPGGEVVLSDVAPEMTAIAAARAAALGLDNVSTRVLDLEEIDAARRLLRRRALPRGAHVRARPRRAPRARSRRVLRPGGRVAIAVWGPRERNPWLGARVRRGQRADRACRCRRPACPGPFSLGDADAARRRCSRAPGSPTSQSTSCRRRCAPALRRVVGAHVGARRAAREDRSRRCPRRPTARTPRARLREAVAPYTTPAGLEFPGVTLIASAAAEPGETGSGTRRSPAAPRHAPMRKTARHGAPRSAHGRVLGRSPRRQSRRAWSWERVSARRRDAADREGHRLLRDGLPGRRRRRGVDGALLQPGGRGAVLRPRDDRRRRRALPPATARRSSLLRHRRPGRVPVAVEEIGMALPGRR